MDIGLRRKGILFPATAALIVLGFTLVSLIWLNLREQRRLAERHMELSAGGLLSGIQTNIMRGLRRFGPADRDLFLPLAREYLNDLTQSGEIAAIAFYTPDGAPLLYAGPDDPPPDMPEDALAAMRRGGEWSGSFTRDGKTFFSLAAPARPGFLGPPRGPAPDPLRPPPRAFLMITLDTGQYLGSYRDIRRTAILQTVYVLVVAAFLWFLTLAYAKRRDQSRKFLRLESFHSKLLDAMPDGLVSLDEHGEISSVSEAAKALLRRLPGAPEGDLVGLPWAALPLAQAAPADSGAEAAWKRLDAAGLSLEILSAPIREPGDGASAPAGRLILIRDRTEMRSLEQDLKEAEELAAIGRLAAGVAHEIRNPLSSLRGFAQFFQTKLKDREPEHTYAATMVHEADRLNRVVTDLLFLAKPRALEPAEVLLAPMIEELGRLLRFDLDAQNVSLDASLAAPNVFADADALKQALLNLLLNSIAAVSRENGAITVRSDAEKNGVRIRVADNGSGMTAEERENALEPFFTTKKKGSGLGLAIVHRIIREHKGRLSIRSEPGKGTEVDLWFPNG